MRVRWNTWRCWGIHLGRPGFSVYLVGQPVWKYRHACWIDMRDHRRLVLGMWHFNFWWSKR